jgi:flagellar hook-associated protein 1 FlgK
MSGLFGTLGVSGRAMLVTQNGIRTTSHNISNANTPGYSRQIQILQPAPAAHFANGALGTGVEQRSIERVTNAFVQEQLLVETSNNRSLQAQAGTLEAIEEVFNEQRRDGISAALSSFYSAFDDLANNPGATEREALMGAAKAVSDTLALADSSLRDQMLAANGGIEGAIFEINALANRIAELNGEIRKQETLTPANDLRDQRDAALRELSGLVDIDTFEDRSGHTVVMLRGSGTLVENTFARSLVPITDPTNPFDSNVFRVYFDDGLTQSDVTDQLSGGELGGLLASRDTILPDALRSLDVVAFNLAESVNAQHRTGFGLDGSTGNDFFAPLAAVEDAARDLRIDAGILTNPDAIAAGGTSGAPGDNQNALLLADLRDTPSTLALPGDPPGPPSGPTRSLLDHVSALVGDIGVETSTVQGARDQSDRVLQVIEDRRDSISGVSIDEEVTNLIRLQASFQANARVLSTIDRLLQDLVDII